MKALQLGRYHLLDRIAFGGMAEIYRAKTFDEQGRVHMVAVKRILSHLARDEEFIKMLVDEARIASLMMHENIARTYEFCHAQGEYFIAMEYVDGKDGRTLLDRCRAQRRWIPPELCAFIMMNAMRALHQAHNQTDRNGAPLNLIHRDVSPSNVICSYSGEVKLCDFGIAKATLSQVQTRSGVIKGKVKYMSPEQAMGRALDLRSDIFSAGSVLYEFLTKVPPFLAPNEMELLVLVRETRYTPVRERNPMVPPALEVIVDSAMSRNLPDRYQTAAQFADALEQYLRIHAPNITRSHLGQFIRQLFADDIDKELRALEEYVVEDHGVEEVGVNLIADDLGPEADYQRFQAKPAGQAEAADLPPQDPERGVIEVERGQGAAGVSNEEPTVILDNEDLAEQGDESAEILWQRSDGSGEEREVSAEQAAARMAALQQKLQGGGSPAPQPQPGSALDPELHDAKTQILDLDDLEGGAAALVEAQAPSDTQPERPDTREVPAAAPQRFRQASTLSGTGPVQFPPHAARTPVDLHEMPTGEISHRSGGTDRVEVEQYEAEIDAYDEAAPGTRDARSTQPLAQADIVSVLEAPSDGGTAELDVSDLHDIAAAGLAEPGTAELEVEDLEEVASLHDRGTDLIEVGDDGEDRGGNRR